MMRCTKPVLLLMASLLLSCSLIAGGEARSNAFRLMNGAYGMSYTMLSAGWGTSYRAGDNFYHQFVVDFTKYRSTCLSRTFKGYGAQLTLFHNKQYSINLKYYTAIRRFAGHTLIPYVGVSPSCFVFSEGSGLNCKPLVGVFWSPFYHLLSGVDINLHCTYGYDIPFINAKSFTAGRHDLSATISVGVEPYVIADFFIKDKSRSKVEF